MSIGRFWVLVSLSFLLIALGACTPSDAVWYGDVQTIVQGNCLSCHGDDAIGTVQLGSYEEAAAAADRMAQQVEERLMPPWLPDAGCNEYHDDRSLSDDEIDRIVGWARRGAPEGDPSASTDAPAPVGGLTDVDFEATVPDYTPDDQGREDDYRCFAIDPGLDEEQFVTALETLPGVDRMVHHVIYFVVDETLIPALEDSSPGPGWTCFGGPGTDTIRGMLGGWVPGQGPLIYPEGTGIQLGPEEVIVMQVHYNFATGPAVADNSGLRLSWEPTIQDVAEYQFVAQFNFSIPAGDFGFSDTTTEALDTETPDARIYGVLPHMHTLGRQISVGLADQPDDECLVDIRRWDFNWQQVFWLAEPAMVEDREIRMRCVWDNDTDDIISWGEGTNDEMCVSFMYMVP